jgi:hypothetical protein
MPNPSLVIAFGIDRRQRTIVSDMVAGPGETVTRLLSTLLTGSQRRAIRLC